MRSIRFSLSVLISIFFSGICLAQQYQFLTSPTGTKVIAVKRLAAPQGQQQSLSPGTPVAYDASQVANSFLLTYGPSFGLNSSLRASQASVTRAKDGFNTVSYKLYWNGILVYGAEIRVVIDSNGSVKFARTNLPGTIPQALSAGIPGLATAQKTCVTGATIAWTAEFPLLAPTTTTGVPVIYVPELLGRRSSSIQLGVLVAVSNADAGRGRKYIVSAADSSTILLKIPDEIGASPAVYLSENQAPEPLNRNIIVLGMGNPHPIYRQIWDCSRPGLDSCYLNYRDFNLNHTFGRPEGAAPTGYNPTYPPPPVQDVDDFYTIVGAIHLYYQQVLNRDGANDLGGLGDGISVPSTTTKVMAYMDRISSWQQACQHLYSDFMDNRIRFCKGLAVADLVEHEYAHGLQRFTHPPIGMTYQDESGTIMEAYSDVSGELFEAYFENLLPNEMDWIFGNLVDGYPVRNLATPPAETYHLSGGASYPYPDTTYAAGRYCGDEDNGGVHFNSTILGRAAYLMTMGGNFNGCTISGLGREKTTQIMYRFMTHYCGVNESFNGAFDEIAEACSDLYTEEDCKQATKALQAVEMDQEGSCRDPTQEHRHPPTCIVEDSDAGDDPDHFGYVTYQGQRYDDACAADCMVDENYIQDYARQHRQEYCPLGCSGGACNSSGLPCEIGSSNSSISSSTSSTSRSSSSDIVISSSSSSSSTSSTSSSSSSSNSSTNSSSSSRSRSSTSSTSSGRSSTGPRPTAPPEMMSTPTPPPAAAD